MSTMQIPQQLPKFEDAPALIVLAGVLNGKIYRAHLGVCEEIAHIEEEVPYEKKEGFFRTQKGGKTLRAGFPYEKDADKEKRALAEKMLAVVSDELKKDSRTIVYAFLSPETHTLFEKLTPNQEKGVWNFVSDKNYTKEHPTQILEHLKEFLAEDA